MRGSSGLTAIFICLTVIPVGPGAEVPTQGQVSDSKRASLRADAVFSSLPVPENASELDRFILSGMQDARVPGLAAVLVMHRKTVWSGSYGWADLPSRTPVTEETLFQIASISKTVTACVVMQLVEQSRLSLDNDVNALLPFPLRNPRHPEVPVTLRQLLTHSSGLRDNWKVLEGTWVKDGDYPGTLAKSMADYFQKDGQYFSAGKNFYEWAPGTDSKYSNTGVALAAYIAERAAGVSFEALCEKNVFEPLGMTGSSFRLATTERSRIAMPYAFRRRQGEFKALGHHGYLDYPAGTLRTTAPQLARFLMSFMGDGTVDDVQILRQQTVRDMRRIWFPEIARGQGLVWFLEKFNGRQFIGHDGSDPGVTAAMFCRPEEGVGFVIMMNAEPGNRKFEKSLIKRLLEYADRHRKQAALRDRCNQPTLSR